MSPWSRRIPTSSPQSFEMETHALGRPHILMTETVDTLSHYESWSLDLCMIFDEHLFCLHVMYVPASQNQWIKGQVRIHDQVRSPASFGKGKVLLWHNEANNSLLSMARCKFVTLGCCTWYAEIYQDVTNLPCSFYRFYTVPRYETCNSNIYQVWRLWRVRIDSVIDVAWFWSIPSFGHILAFSVYICLCLRKAGRQTILGTQPRCKKTVGPLISIGRGVISKHRAVLNPQPIDVIH